MSKLYSVVTYDEDIFLFKLVPFHFLHDIMCCNKASSFKKFIGYA